MTKLLLLLLVGVVAVLLWRSRRAPREPHPPAAAQQPCAMVRCALCDVHLPLSDALAGPDGQPYCSAEHRLRARA